MKLTLEQYNQVAEAGDACSRVTERPAIEEIPREQIMALWKQLGDTVKMLQQLLGVEVKP